jgi:hypothetical protein
MAGLRVRLHERASYRHRGIVLEGAVHLQNVLDLIDWAPKVGFSAYFVQFREGFTFFDRWFSHRCNPTLAPEPFSLEQARACTRRIEDELRLRGLIHHAVGHGWTCEAFGIPGLGWDQEERDYAPEVLASLAEVDGTRGMRWKIPMITSLCFSQPRVREKVVAEVAAYASAHPQVDLLHVWLDDGFNNKCECAGCRGKRPADFYVDLLDEIDAELTRKGSTQKIVFLAYQDVLWPPETSRLRNPERFTFMFAPIERDYGQPLVARDRSLQPPPFALNRLSLPRTSDEHLAFLRAWQQVVNTDSFIFEYYFTIGMQGPYTYDPSHLAAARQMHAEIRELRAHRLNGMLSCQVQRVFLPSGLAMTVMGRTLWDDSVDFDALAADYFGAAFGEDGARCHAYLAALAEPFDWLGLREKPPAPGGARPRVRERVAAAVEAFAPVVERNRSHPHPTVARSWEYLHWHSKIVALFAGMADAHAAGDLAGKKAAWAEVRSFLQENEPRLQPVLDVWSLVDGFDKLLAKQTPG